MYISRADQARADWLTLPHLVAQIRKAEPCSARAAHKQIRDMLVDGVLLPLRWGDRLPETWSREPPQKGQGWLTAEINWRSGKVLDNDDDGLDAEGRAIWQPKWRVLLIHRIPVRDILQQLRSTRENAGSASTENISKMASEAMIHDTIREVYDEAKKRPGKPPNVKEVVTPVQKILTEKGFRASGRNIERLAGDPRYAADRLKPGERPKS
jgi:hypothetical protein